MDGKGQYLHNEELEFKWEVVDETLLPGFRFGKKRRHSCHKFETVVSCDLLVPSSSLDVDLTTRKKKKKDDCRPTSPRTRPVGHNQ